MELQEFEIRNCFGFANPDRLLLRGAGNLIYILGRNSSGKSSLLNALAYFDSGLTPQEYPNFKNFNDKGGWSGLFAYFATKKGDLSIEDFMSDVEEKLRELGIDDPRAKADDELQERLATLRAELRKHYIELIERIEEKEGAWVRRDQEGSYSISAEPNFNDSNKRVPLIKRAIAATFPSDRIISTAGWKTVDFPSQDVENLLYNQFPRSILFRDTYSLASSLPDRITSRVLGSSDQNGVLQAFITYLGKENISRYLTLDSPSEQRRLEKEMQTRVDELSQKVNRARSLQNNADLLEFILHHHKDGLQITVLTDGKESFYRHISDNTKFLFAYYLFQAAENIEGSILLFDEPSNGFHATAQEFILNFLEGLADNGNQVIVSTHSEYLIDPDRLSGVRIMGVDDSGNLQVKNHYYSQVPGPRQGDYLALRPLLDAIGLKYSRQITIQDKVVLTEGVTDMLYMRTFNSILGYVEALHIAPARGEDTILHVIPLLISQGMRFKVVVDTGKGKWNIKAKIKQGFDLEDEHIWQVAIPATSDKKQGSGIEDLFSRRDFRWLLESFGLEVTNNIDCMSNSEYMKTSKGPKRLVAHWFYGNCQTRPIEDFEAETIQNFRAVLEFCHNDHWFSI